MQGIQDINTDRLLLKLLNVESLNAFALGDIDQVRRSVGFDIPDSCGLLGQAVVNLRLGLIEKDATQFPWMIRAIVRKEDLKMVGSISFHHKAPDPDLLKFTKMGAELGYGVDQDYRRSGYATESAIGMMNWAHSKFAVDEFILTISPDNIASLEMAKSMGFEIIDEWNDPVDGLEYVMKAEYQHA